MSLPKHGWVLDTNTLTHLTKSSHKRHALAKQVFAELAQMAAQKENTTNILFVPTIVIFEAKRGMFKTGAARQELELDRFLEAYGLVVDFDKDAAICAARLWAHANPRHNDDNDLMILGTAIALEADLITEDDPIKNVQLPIDIRLWTWDALAAELSAQEE